MRKPGARDWSRREVLAAGAASLALPHMGCGQGGGPGGAPDAASGDLGTPFVAADVWQTMAGYVRAGGGFGTRVNLFNPASAASRVDLQVFTLDGRLVVKELEWELLPPGQSRHLELEEFLAARGVPLPFEGSLWAGTQPESGDVFMGLQGISFDWYGPAHQASVHGMRDFGNSNGDMTWTDLIYPRVRASGRYVTRLAVHNASGEGTSEALIAHPLVTLRDVDGNVVAESALPALAPYTTQLVDLAPLLGGATLDDGTVQIREPEAGLVALAFLWDLDNGGIASADHLFDRHFVTNSAGFTGG